MISFLLSSYVKFFLVIQDDVQWSFTNEFFYLAMSFYLILSFYFYSNSQCYSLVKLASSWSFWFTNYSLLLLGSSSCLVMVMVLTWQRLDQDGDRWRWMDHNSEIEIIFYFCFWNYISYFLLLQDEFVLWHQRIYHLETLYYDWRLKGFWVIMSPPVSVTTSRWNKLIILVFLSWVNHYLA